MESDLSDSQELAVASVLLDDALLYPLDYGIPKEWLGQVKRGMRVKVPVKNSKREGTILSLKDKSAFKRLQVLSTLLLEQESIPEDLMQLSEWISHYYCTPQQITLRSMLPPSVRGNAQPKLQKWIKLAKPKAQIAQISAQIREKHPKQVAVLDILLKAPKGMFLSKLLEKTEGSSSPVQTLIKQGLILSKPMAVDRLQEMQVEYLQTSAKRLNTEQQEALECIQTTLDAHAFHVRLLHGVTGSGKTEVYLQAIDHAFKQGKGVIFLVPEIALTSQMIEKLKSRFQSRIAILHSRLSQGERFDAWHQMRSGKITLAIGARSAIFSPIQNLGLIIVDEEHESSYKQADESPTYHARDVAIMRGKICNATLVLGSATPSLESYHNAKSGKYSLSTLSVRADSAQMPRVTLIDMKQECERQKQFTLFSDPLIRAIKERLELGEQIILFLNRRGYHTTQMCTHCGKSAQCPHCDVNLTFHLNDNLLACHLCNLRLSPPPKICPYCQQDNTIKFKGVGTELVEKTLHALIPEVRTLRLDADTTRHKGSHEMLFKQFRSGKADVLIGTQMIAKGLHFPQVTLVAVLHADGGLQIPDFRASETTFQLLIQVSGRSGRGALPGEVLIQTHLPDHPILALAKTQEYEPFFKEEMESRELFHYPPFNRLIKLTFRGKDPQTTESYANKVRSHLLTQVPQSVEILPVVPSGHPKVKDLFRFQFLIKTPKIPPLIPLLQKIKREKAPIQTLIDIDPLSTFF